MSLRESTETSVTSRDIRAFLEDGCELEGKLHFSGVVRLNGRLKGDISTSDVLIIGQTAEIEGSIAVGAIVIGGKIHGNIEAKQRVELLSTAFIEGSITAPILVIHEGAKIIGQISVGGESLAELRQEAKLHTQ